jgi:YesN/AraC family two-component response regulator
MPGNIDGLELARRVTARWPQVKIVLTSGFPETKINGNGGSISERRLLSKPYRKDDLARVLREVLDS